jgi:peptide/nickel transport system ATP-binding protein
LPVVAQLAARIAVMQGGRVVETGSAEQILERPAHPYTKALVAAVPALPA